MRSTRMAAVAAGVALMTGLTACGSEQADGGGGDEAKGGGSAVQGALAALKRASTATEEKNSAAADGVQKTTTQGKTMSSELKGAFDWSSGGIQGEVEATADGSATTIRYLSDAMYMKLQKPMQGKQWVKTDYETMAEQSASGAMLKDQMQNNNPARSVQLLLASGKVKSAGTETVRGAEATHYSGTLTPSELVRMQSKDLKESDKKALEQQFEKQGITEEKIDLWIDENDLLVKKEESFETKDGSSSENTVFYSDYGTEVEVSAPPASQTLESSRMKASGGAELS
ncbi:hypothetical protein ABZ820_06030 [Streptomyces diacarni]|uniref:hypothetical protein n=1 Tax=Streptomyces diacarni TaxID=2800381 RepID=UPI0033FEC383